ncbi:MAG: VWA domain-containing protein [Planctomycetota bacterium]
MSVSMNQRMVWAGRGGSVAFWAWMVSIVVHLIVLTAFGAVTFSPCRQQAGAKAQGEARPTPMAKISRITKLMQAAPIIPKPKIKKSAESRFARKPDKLLPTNRVFGVLKPDSQKLGELAEAVHSQSVFLLSSSADLPHRIEFFGSRTEQRKVCYLVDCSGSMRGIFGEVRKKLKESIGNLQPDQYFYIIFFGNGRLFEFGDNLLRATHKTKSAAYAFIDSIRPAGQTNALAALERAVQIRDGGGVAPSLVYFLTDGFELMTEDTQRFSQKIANLLARFAPRTRINTIGFWPQSDDRKMLEAIARQSGGEFVLITDDAEKSKKASKKPKRKKEIEIASLRSQ